MKALEMREKKSLKNKGCTYKIANVSPAMGSSVCIKYGAKLLLRHCTITLRSDMLKIFTMDNHEF